MNISAVPSYKLIAESLDGCNIEFKVESSYSCEIFVQQDQLLFAIDPEIPPVDTGIELRAF